MFCYFRTFTLFMWWNIIYHTKEITKRNLYKEVFALWEIVAVIVKFFGSLFCSYYFSVVAVTEAVAVIKRLTYVLIFFNLGT